VHHDRPALAWYRLPAVWRAERRAILRANHGYRFAGYGEILRRWAFSPKESPVHPLGGLDAGGHPGERVAFARETGGSGMDGRGSAAV
jgi:hypothetical protein